VKTQRPIISDDEHVVLKFRPRTSARPPGEREEADPAKALPAVNDLLGNQVDFSFQNVNAVLPHIKAGKLKAIAVTGNKRSPVLPDVPTFAEGNVPKFDLQVWNALAAPAGTPPAVIAVLEAALAKSLENEEVKTRFAELAAQAPSKSELGGPALQNLIKSDVDRWTTIVKEAKLDAQ
jgi:tripartite-type tricarboxylate transporter receptor subunit TctC